MYVLYYEYFDDYVTITGDSRFDGGCTDYVRNATKFNSYNEALYWLKVAEMYYQRWDDGSNIYKMLIKEVNECI